MARLDHVISGLRHLTPGVSQSAAAHPAILGRGTRGAYIRRQSRPSNRAANCDPDRRITPSLTGGHLNVPPSRRFQISTSPVPSYTSSLTRSARFERNTKTVPLNGSCCRIDCTVLARPSAPRRKSTGRVATSTRTPGGKLPDRAEIMSPSAGGRPCRETPSRRLHRRAAQRRQSQSRSPRCRKRGDVPPRPVQNPDPERRYYRARRIAAPGATYKADCDVAHGAARPCSPPPPARSSPRQSPPSPPRSSAAVAALRSKPQPAGNCAHQLANYLANQPPYPA